VPLRGECSLECFRARLDTRPLVHLGVRLTANRYENAAAVGLCQPAMSYLIPLLDVFLDRRVTWPCRQLIEAAFRHWTTSLDRNFGSPHRFKESFVRRVDRSVAIIAPR
jgi:hypothetical protein